MSDYAVQGLIEMVDKIGYRTNDLIANVSAVNSQTLVSHVAEDYADIKLQMIALDSSIKIPKEKAKQEDYRILRNKLQEANNVIRVYHSKIIKHMKNLGIPPGIMESILHLRIEILTYDGYFGRSICPPCNIGVKATDMDDKSLNRRIKQDRFLAMAIAQILTDPDFYHLDSEFQTGMQALMDTYWPKAINDIIHCDSILSKRCGEE